jgi:Leucine-rich repeat (LRR) protein
VVGLSNFSKLEILDLNGNSFTGSISPYIGALSSLKAMSLGYNDLNGTLPEGKNQFFIICYSYM